MKSQEDLQEPDSFGSISLWIQQATAGQSLAAQQLWQAYIQRLVALAARKLGSRPKRMADEEDVALSAFHAFLDGARQGRFPQLHDRDDLWQILVMLTERKAASQLRQELAEKRGQGNVRGDSVFGGSPDASLAAGLDAVAASEPSPEMAVILGDQLQTLLDSLAEDTQRSVALAKLQGMGNAEIARDLGISLRSVERKLSLIRRRWQEVLPA